MERENITLLSAALQQVNTPIDLLGVYLAILRPILFKPSYFKGLAGTAGTNSG